MGDTCPDCGEEHTRLNQHLSMSDCGGDHSSKSELECQHCGETFTEWTYRVEKGDGKYCSPECRDKDKREGKVVECDRCGSETYKSPVHLKNNDHFFCGLDCEAEWRSEAFSGEGSPNWKGGNVTAECERCGKEYGVKPSEKEKSKYCSWSCKQATEMETRECATCGESITRPARDFKGERAFCSHDHYKDWMSEWQRGSNNPAWKGGKSGIQAVRKMIGNQSWDKTAREVRKEDGHVCQRCGEFQIHRKLSVHHIIPVASGGTNGKWNLMALCESCHGEVEEYTKQFTEPHLHKYAKGES